MYVDGGRVQTSTPTRTRYSYSPGPSLAEVLAGTGTIQRGHSGEDVRAMQRALNAAGAQPPLAEDGLFGPKTQAALQRFQGQNGLAANGVLDPAALSRLSPYFNGARAPEPRGDGVDPNTHEPRRAPQVGQRAPSGTVRAGGLQQQDEAARSARRRASTTGPSLPAPRSPSARGTTDPRPPTRTPSGPVPAPSLPGGSYDGRTPAPETTSRRASAPVEPPLTTSAAQGRDPNTYAQVINQFGVGNNPRYEPRNGNTYCNIFAWDVTRAMGAELPHWIRRDGTPAQAFERGAHEMNANGTARWLREHGSEHGWRRVSAEEAQRHANGGAPAIAIRENPGGIGHVAVVRPGELTDRGPAIAQAGSRCVNEAHVRDIWRRAEPEYYVHD